MSQSSEATFAAGCFWGVQAHFAKHAGIISTEVGYTGGHTKHPSYQDVCTGNTGHAEAVRIIFDTKQTTYEELLRLFWSIHNPTTLNKQGPDVGSQYRSAVFYHTDKQRHLALAIKAALEASEKFQAPIITEIEPVGDFFVAEDYHQDYLAKQHRK